MSWKAKIFKPGWESRNSEKRLHSIQSENSQTFWNTLPGLINTDPDYQVRLAAFNRLLTMKSKDLLKRFEFTLHALENLPTQSSAEEQKHFNQYKQALKLQLTKWLGKLPLPKDLCERFITRFCSPEQICNLAQKAQSLEVRSVAIEKITANGILGDIAITESDRQLRRQAVAKIEQTSTLSRVAKAIRTRDKKLYKQIEERIFQAEGHNSAEVTAHQGDEICAQLEQLLKKVGRGSQPDPSTLVKRWEEMQSPPNKLQQQRFQTLLKTLQIALDGSAIEVASKTEVIHESTKSLTDTAAAQQAEQEIISAVANREKEQRIARENDRNAQQVLREKALKERLEKQQSLLSNLQAQQDQLATLIEAGDLKQALKQLHKTRTELAHFRKLRPPKSQLSSLEGRQLRLHGRIKKLRDYQHWANNKVRSEMIEKLQSVNISELHPDAVKSMLVDARKQWQALEAGEQLPGDKYFHAPASLWHQFNQTCDLAATMIQPFLEKRQQIQSEHLQEDIALLATGKELLASQSPATRELLEHQRKLRAAIRALEEIPAKQRGKTAHRIREQLGQLQEKISSAFDQIKTEKSRLIRQAEQLKHIEDKAEAINQAKQLQRQWQAAGSGSRKVEQPLWQTFRNLLDPLFAEQAEEISTQREAVKQQRQQLTSICNDLQDICKLKATEALGMGGRVQSLQNDWQENGGNALPQKDKLKLKFNRTVQQFQKILQQAKQQQAIQQRQSWLQKEQLLQQLYASLQRDKQTDVSKMIAAWPSHPADTKIDKILNEKLQLLQSNGVDEFDPSECQANIERYRTLCLSLEYLAGLESPAAEKQQRMDMQIQRLAGNLSGAVTRLSLAEEAAELEQKWYELPLLSEQNRSDFSARFHAAIAEINEQLSHLE